MIKLRNLGPKSLQMLSDTGIDSIEKLRALGSVKAYFLVCQSSAKSINTFKPSVNLLYAIEGALSDRPWQDVARNDKLSLLLSLEQMQNQIL